MLAEQPPSCLTLLTPLPCSQEDYMPESESSKFATLFQRNQFWAERIKAINPNFFLDLSRQQKPEFLWIGCADSRVPANEIIDLPPGEVFVHRNIANVVVPSDLNCLSVIQYAVEVLQIRHIIVCGHYGCGGVKAAMSSESHGLIDNWLQHIRNVMRLHPDAFEGMSREDERVDRLCELNVIEQVNNVCATTIVRDAWARGIDLRVDGWVYSIKDGILRGLCSRGPRASAANEGDTAAEAATTG
jgi:carbonic anhydrase